MIRTDFASLAELTRAVENIGAAPRGYRWPGAWRDRALRLAVWAPLVCVPAFLGLLGVAWLADW